MFNKLSSSLINQLEKYTVEWMGVKFTLRLGSRTCESIPICEFKRPQYRKYSTVIPQTKVGRRLHYIKTCLSIWGVESKVNIHKLDPKMANDFISHLWKDSTFRLVTLTLINQMIRNSHLNISVDENFPSSILEPGYDGTDLELNCISKQYDPKFQLSIMMQTSEKVSEDNLGYKFNKDYIVNDYLKLVSND